MHSIHAKMFAMYLESCLRAVRTPLLAVFLACWLAPWQIVLAAPSQAAELIVVVNPRSGRFVKHPGEIQQIKDLVGSHGTVYVPTTNAEFRQVAREVAHLPNPEKKYLALAGGDGLITRFFTDVDRENPEQLLSFKGVVPLKGGSNNTVVKNFTEMSKSPVAVLQNLIAAMRTDPTALQAESPYEIRDNPTPMLQVNGHRGLYFVAGVPANLLADIKGKIDVRKAFLSVLFQMMTGSKRLHRVPAKLTVNGVRDDKERKMLFTIASGLTKTHPLLQRMLKKPNPGEFSVKASSMSIPETIAKSFELVTGAPLTRNPKKQISESTKKVQIEFQKPGENYTLDGEPLVSEGKNLTVFSRGEVNLVSVQKRKGARFQTGNKLGTLVPRLPRIQKMRIR